MSSFALAPKQERSGGYTNLTAGGQYTMDLYVFKTWLKARFTDTERGATMVEYILILALIAILVIGVVAALGGRVSEKFSKASSGLGTT
jgi:Flp pilus assembly pilin Flp